MLKGLLNILEPVGQLEELLVEKLALLSWRQRRLLAAEAAAIRKNTEFVEWDRSNRQRDELYGDEDPESRLEEMFNSTTGTGIALIRRIQNPEIFNRCLELLNGLREAVASGGFDEERDSSILETIYGNQKHAIETLKDKYSTWQRTAEAEEEEREQEGYATAQECIRALVNAIDREIGELSRYKKTNFAIESERTAVEVLRHQIPDSEDLDRLLRYETSLERAFDRALSQLERIQRLRRGQPAAPRIDINVSGRG